ncbi:DUF948 domain-containing protein [Paenibacillus ginsengarvi]|uniref:DUF948 domain-containing protein n=1 Tax=Paenibacillus ginsengarvi TaxID=400777 RepID=A0A3B0CKA3_9BACL|nr:DUF948 domain-containing protein [Paenibacillus ginsengarvi]RKN85420.1 DUF948 domain-containing protein [Paenibacillus ginsengarvi]
MIIQISVACIATAFIVLVVYLVAALQTARASLKQVNETLVHIDAKLDAVTGETVKLMQQTQQIADNVQGKMNSLDTLFHSIGQVGESVSEVTASVKQVSATVSNSVRLAGDKVNRERNTTAELMEWASLALHLWRKWQSRKRPDIQQQKQQQPDERKDHNV